MGGALVILLISCENKRLQPFLHMVLAQGISFSTLRNIPLLPQGQRHWEKMEKLPLQSKVLEL